MDLKIEVQEDIEAKWLEIEEVEFPGFRVKVKYIAPDALTRMQAKCQETVRGVRGAADRTSTDMVRWSRLIVEKVVLDWEGFKLEYLEAMLPITDKTREQIRAAGGTVPFSTDAATVLAQKGADRVFVGPIVRYVSEWGRFNEKARADEKKDFAA